MSDEVEPAGVAERSELFRIVPAVHERSPNTVLVARLRLSSRGRITIPKLLRDKMGLRQGDKLDHVPLSDGTYSVRKVE